MELTKEMILDKTHRGLTIYAHILRHFYPDQTVIRLVGRKCETTRNPFKNDRQSLVIQEVDNCFKHSDPEDQDFSGDAFDFASLFFKVPDHELLSTINEQLYLRVGENPWKRNDLPDIEVIKYEPPQRPVLPKFSYFKAPVTNTSPLKEVSLLDAYHAIKYEYQEPTLKLRELTDSKPARKFKAAHFDYVTFSGIFTSRNDKALQKHSGLLALDFDHVEDLPSLRQSLIDDPYFDTEILFTSPSGDGLKWIISIDIAKHTHQDWFAAIRNYIRQTYHLEIDSAGKDVSRACFLPHDPDIFLHPKYRS